MNEYVAMRADNDKENQQYLYRSLSHCYLTITIPYEMACH
jgi:hypothetical protein